MYNVLLFCNFQKICTRRNLNDGIISQRKRMLPVSVEELYVNFRRILSKMLKAYHHECVPEVYRPDLACRK